MQLYEISKYPAEQLYKVLLKLWIYHNKYVEHWVVVNYWYIDIVM